MIVEKAGGKKAAIKSAWHRLQYKLGGYKQYSLLDWSRVNRLVFVCMGNINRSAYGEAKARAIGLSSTSYGIDADETKGASIEAIRNGKSRGIDLTSHHCRSLGNIELQDGDLVLAVEPGHLPAIQQAIEIHNRDQALAQVSLLGIWSEPTTPFLQDPICRSDVYFSTCFDRIDQAIVRIAREMQTAQTRQRENPA
jgi:protein-tyrosine phosphatase